MNKQVQVAVCRIVTLATTLEGCDVFVEWLPHVMGLNVRFFQKGWHPGDDPAWKQMVYLDWATADQELTALYDRISSEGLQAAEARRSRIAEEAVMGTVSPENEEAAYE
jgi:hypothetical protein